MSTSTEKKGKDLYAEYRRILEKLDTLKNEKGDELKSALLRHPEIDRLLDYSKTDMGLLASGILHNADELIAKEKSVRAEQKKKEEAEKEKRKAEREAKKKEAIIKELRENVETVITGPATQAVNSNQGYPTRNN